MWDYYAEIACELGKTRRETQSNFSVWWIYKYYQSHPDQFNELARAFVHNERGLYLVEDIECENFYVEDNPNPEQQQAIRTALCEKVSFIQGPPGTGKSMTILNLMSVITAGLGKTVLMASANNAAVGVIAEKIARYAQLEEDGELITRNRRLLSATYAELGNQRKISEFVARHPEYRFKHEKDEELGVSVEKNVSFSQFSRNYKAITSTLHSMKKLFTEGPNLQYDYVIIDEASQVNTILGLIALTSAKHLIIVGDEEQLPPVIKLEKISEVTRRYRNHIPADFLIKENEATGNPPSFLDMCQKTFLKDDRSNKVLLKAHYRCHPGIIEFCNRNVYNHQLRVCTNPVDTAEYKVPIKVLWYQGDYCEKVDIDESEAVEVSKRNGKQVKIFMEEEFPVLLDRMMNPETNTMDSFCVLAPFRGILLELGKNISHALVEREIREDIAVEVNGELIEGDESDSNQSFPLLSVHKSQGREYDVVYFLPVEDANWEKPWYQGKSLINVAVSRCKEELRIITSTSLMSSHMQQALTGSEYFIADTEPHPENFRFVQKLIDYVKIANESKDEYEANKAVWDPQGKYEDLELTGIASTFPVSDMSAPTDFGFFRSGVRSIFDALPIIRRDSREITDDWAAPEQCVIQSIITMPEFAAQEMNLYTNVQLPDFVHADGGQVVTREQIWSVLENHGHVTPEYYQRWRNHLELHVDMVLCDRDRNVLLLIEVDGALHRFDPDVDQYEDQVIRDEAKDELLEQFFMGIPVLRFPTDGTGCDEVERIREALNCINAEEMLSDICIQAKSITKINRERAGELKASLLQRGYLVERHMWKIEPDGESWKMSSEDKLIPIPTTNGHAAGILRHFGVNGRTGEPFFNPEYLSRAEILMI